MNLWFKRRNGWSLAGTIATVGALVISQGVAIAAPGVTPSSVSVNLNPGATHTVTKTVETPTIPPKPDICFLADTTGSMGGAIANVQANATTIMSTVLASSPDAQFCAAQYRDAGSSPVFAVDQTVTANTSAVQTAINTWAAGGGGDQAEGQLHALTLLSGAAAGWRAAPATHVIVWFGDNPGHDPSVAGETLASTITALTTGGAGAPITVIAVSVNTGGAGLDGAVPPDAPAGQATAITSATGGSLQPANPAAVAAAILAGLQNLPVTVTHSVGACDPNLTVVISPASQTGASGSTFVFTETITVAAGAPQGATLTCTVQFLVNGQPAPEFTQSISIKVNDVTPPVAQCVPTTNPSGKNIPSAGDNPKSGQNPDGFYQLIGTDNLPGVKIELLDGGSSFVAGPFASGDKIKLTQAPGVTPSQEPGAGDVDWKIKFKGDATLRVTDAAGNVATASCLVPPLPK